MTVIGKMSSLASCLVAALIVVGSAHAQSRPATPAPAAAPAQPPPETDAIFARWDKDNNKSLSAAEFAAGWKEVQATMLLMKLHENFVAMDANKSGFLEAPEYANLELIKKAGASAPPLSAFDADKSHSLDFKEYVGMVKTMLTTKP